MTPTTRKTLKLRAGGEDRIRHAAHLRGLNLERVLAVAMDRVEPFTRAELIEATGLSAPTVGSLASHLIRAGLIRDLGTGPSRGGRRPSCMEFNARHGFVAGIDLGPTHTRLAIGDLRGEVVAHRVVPTPRRRSPETLLAKLAADTRALMKETQIPVGRLLAVGAGAPGAVDRQHGRVVALAPNLTGWADVPMAKILEQALGVPVVVENDVNLAILAERWRGVAQGHDTCAFVALGTGIGAGIVVHGELHHGHHFVAGEIALMCMGAQYVDTDFGARGCLETLTGLKALATRWSQVGPIDRDGWVGALFDAARGGDARAVEAVENTATLLGIATANLSVVLDPSLIVFGGSLVAQAPSLVEEIRKVVARIVPTPSPIVVSQLGQEAPLWGSLLVATAEARERLRQRLIRR
jgi:predicted NBD/HSP70 family sugar kinase